MKKIIVVTHCEASHSVEGKVGGWYDSELTTRGRAQAGEVLDRLKTLSFQPLEVYSSDLKRAAQTAEILSEIWAIAPKMDPRLREMSFGTHEGMSQTEHQNSMVPVNPTGSRLDHRICEGAESRRDVATRTAEFMEEIMKNDGDSLIVSHGFAVTFIIAAFQMIDVSSLGYISFPLAPGSITYLEEDDLFCNRSVRFVQNEFTAP